MKTVLIFIAFPILLFLLHIPAYSQIPPQIADYFEQGDFYQAKGILEEYLTSYPNDKEALLYLAQLEPEGTRSMAYFENILNLPKGFDQEDRILLGLCQYNFSKEDYLISIDLADRFEAKFKRSPYYPEILWLFASSLLANGEAEKAQEKYQLLSNFPDDNWRSLGSLGNADCFFASGKFPLAVDEYKKLIDEFENSDIVSLALIQISNCYAEMGNKDKAILYYNLYKEKSPYGIGMEENTKNLVKPQEAKKGDSGKAERMVSARYTIQLGVFGVKENADGVYSKFKAEGYKMRMFDKIINQKKYYIVQLGDFVSYEEAQKLREKLEKETGESYRIILR
ncbi:MAG: SPOR domain-containing protein [candidate division Zixibacteria bacterium]|nr:SPOR domain-containing protein [candidate division Zixibacteria bacterium]